MAASKWVMASCGSPDCRNTSPNPSCHICVNCWLRFSGGPAADFLAVASALALSPASSQAVAASFKYQTARRQRPAGAAGGLADDEFLRRQHLVDLGKLPIGGNERLINLQSLGIILGQRQRRFERRNSRGIIVLSQVTTSRDHRVVVIR